MAIMRPPQRVLGAEAPRMVSKFHFLKRFIVLAKESIFQKSATFFLPKNPFLLRKISKNGADFTGISYVFRMSILKFYFL